ncbi:MAG TPA: polyprenyl diphosphate synthase [Solirubrobacteraceae bacterium]|nr:polyprenyl diphosphate synthase [Solirubrobacteraceae bacterium]
MPDRTEDGDRLAGSGLPETCWPTAQYVAIITDGNGRWADRRGVDLAIGYDAAADTLKARVRDAVELGVKELMVFVFSTENWSRPASEVEGLMDMFSRRIPLETRDLHREGVRVRFIGARDALSGQLVEQMERAETMTEANSGMTLCLAFNYGGRAEIVEAARQFDGSSEAEFRRGLWIAEMHDPELIIRTGGEQRLSNFLLWQSAYSELVFRDELWPDFGREAFEASLREYGARVRRFGGR